jgi:hypothetical protein
MRTLYMAIVKILTDESSPMETNCSREASDTTGRKAIFFTEAV